MSQKTIARMESRGCGYMLYDKEGMPHLATLADKATHSWSRLKISKEDAVLVGWQCVKVVIQPCS
ncbi:MAG TPA: hypothetical protein VE135_13760 [Pyrinomonadaceae bacterium]|nr:hypothetical protein [Pyrinomonadaceae bacterium]